jgi:hypothetical protein
VWSAGDRSTTEEVFYNVDIITNIGGNIASSPLSSLADWFTYQGTGKLEYVETADWHSTSITSHIAYNATNCGDFDGSGSINIADVIYVIRYIFSGGFPPIDIHGGDVDCDNTCDISDIVYLLTYVFSGGATPCNGCK